MVFAINTVYLASLLPSFPPSLLPSFPPFTGCAISGCCRVNHQWQLLHGLLPSALCPLPSALCPLPSALCPLPSALCPLPSALCPLPPLPSALCPLPSALCPLPFGLCLALCPALCPTFHFSLFPRHRRCLRHLPYNHIPICYIINYGSLITVDETFPHRRSLPLPLLPLQQC